MSGRSRRMLLFRRATMCLSAAALFCLWPCESHLCPAQTSTPDEPQIALKVKNDFVDTSGTPRAVTLRLWSEKPWNPANPVREQVLRAGQLATIDLLSPDRYTVELQWQNNVWRTLPMHLKRAAKEHPDKALLLSVFPKGQPGGVTLHIPPDMHLSFGVPPKEGDFAGSSDTLRDREFNQDFFEPSNWPRTIKFRNVYRDATGKAQAVEVRMRPNGL